MAESSKRVAQLARKLTAMHSFLENQFGEVYLDYIEQINGEKKDDTTGNGSEDKIHKQKNKQPRMFEEGVGLSKMVYQKFEVTRDELKKNVGSKYWSISLASKNRQIRCKVCDTVLRGEFPQFERHFYAKHSVTKPFKCKICNKPFTRKDKLNIHMKNVCGGEGSSSNKQKKQEKGQLEYIGHSMGDEEDDDESDHESLYSSSDYSDE